MFMFIREKYAKALENPQARYWIKEWVEPILIAFILAMFIRTFFVQAFKIPTGSMRETLLEGDRILVNKCAYWFKQPERGDVVVFRYPIDKKKDFIKRLIGKPGERIRLEKGKIYVNDQVVDSPEIIRNTYYYTNEMWPYGHEGEEFTVPDNSFFVLGDNSGHSHDSRAWGFVDRKYVKGRAFFIFWPPQRWRVVN